VGWADGVRPRPLSRLSDGWVGTPRAICRVPSDPVSVADSLRESSGVEESGNAAGLVVAKVHTGTRAGRPQRQEPIEHLPAVWIPGGEGAPHIPRARGRIRQGGVEPRCGSTGSAGCACGRTRDPPTVHRGDARLRPQRRCRRDTGGDRRGRSRTNGTGAATLQHRHRRHPQDEYRHNHDQLVSVRPIPRPRAYSIAPADHRPSPKNHDTTYFVAKCGPAVLTIERSDFIGSQESVTPTSLDRGRATQFLGVGLAGGGRPWVRSGQAGARAGDHERGRETVVAVVPPRPRQGGRGREARARVPHWRGVRHPVWAVFSASAASGADTFLTPALEDAVQFLLGELADGPRLSVEVVQAAKEQGIPSGR